MKILSLDMASNKTGYAYFNNEELIDYGLWDISNNGEKDWRKRIAQMAQFISDYCDNHKVDKIYAEDVPPISENVQTVKVLASLQGMLISLGIAKSIEIEFISVTTWKTKVGINLDKSAECRRIVKKAKAEKSAKDSSKLRTWIKGWEKKISVEYANHIYGLNLIYKSPSSKFNQDDIADAINIGYSQISADVKPYDLDTFENISNHLYNSL